MFDPEQKRKKKKKKKGKSIPFETTNDYVEYAGS